METTGAVQANQWSKVPGKGPL